MRPAFFALLAAPAVLGGFYSSFRAGLYDAHGAGFPLVLVAAVLAASALAGWGLEVATARAVLVQRSTGVLVFEAAAALFSLFSPALLGSYEMPLAFALFSLLGLRLLRSEQADRHAAALLVGLDFAVEAVLVYRGAYGYRHSMVSPLPVWLPAVWANLGIACWRLFPLLPSRTRAAAPADMTAAKPSA